jgi:two-component system NtrC family sensor kinase
MNPLAVSAFFTAITCLVLGGMVFFRKRGEDISRSYLLFLMSVFVWIFGIGMEIEAPNKNWGLFWNQWLYSGAIFIPTFFIQFVQSYLGKIRRNPLTSCYIISIVLLIFNFTPLFVKDVVPKGSFNYASVPGIIFPFFALYFFLGLIYSFFLIIKELRNSVGIKRNQLKFVLLGSVIGFSGGSTNYLLVFDVIHIPPIGNYFLALGLFIHFYAIIRHRDINIVLTKGATYGLTGLLLLIPSATLVILGQRHLFKEINYVSSMILLLILLLVADLFQKVKPRTERAVERFLFKDRYDYRDTLGKFSKALVSILDLQSLSKRIIDTITQTMGVEKASLFLISEEKGGYNLCESKNVKITTSTQYLPKDDPLPLYLQKVGEIIIREELAKRVHIPVINNVVNEMSSLEAEVSIPLMWKEQLIGMINLSHKFTRDIYSGEDIELLNTLANQTAIAIENARLYEDLKRSKSYIRRADRLASLGTLTAGLAHEIRNPLVAIKTFTHLLPERIDDQEFRDKFLQIASGEVDRISSLVTELLDFARTSDPKLEMENINIILDGMILLVSTETNKKQINVDKTYDFNLPFVEIDREQMKQVFLNILLNAIEATPEKGKITIRTRSFLKPGGEPYVQIEFTDTGCGIPSDQIEEIFNPFFTTKTTGSGLGLSISNQIVQDHKGYIDVESQMGKGSSFFVNLPVNQNHPKRRKDDSENNRDISDVLEKRRMNKS